MGVDNDNRYWTIDTAIRDVEMLIQDGFDPVHAVYMYIQQISSSFAEGASQLPELKEYDEAGGGFGLVVPAVLGGEV